MARFATLTCPLTAWDGPAKGCEDGVLDHARALDKFLADIERRALRMAQVALRDTDDALDAVQDAMLKLARHYAARPASEWRPLFYRILQNGIRDVQRRRTLRRRLMAWIPGPRQDPDGEAPDPVEAAVDPGPDGAQRLMQAQAIEQLEESLRALPTRQREAFMLRNLEGLDVAQTARAMGCSQGSVKTHYSRAVHSLRAQLGEVW
ncbi:MAG TPA: RNA polymerase sigma factor [Steroidobacteraceae bacterium]|nr:RNA polymerase sigma factor [Steroidobacteraceae bacterium]